jgi:hypothetical protein
MTKYTATTPGPPAERGSLDIAAKAMVAKIGSEFWIVPLFVQGKQLAAREAIALAMRTREHLGSYKTLHEAARAMGTQR